MIKGMLFPFLGGLGLFLYGMKIMSEGLQKAAGDRLRKILEKLTTNRIVAFLVGIGVTAVIQSSSATTVMVVGFVNAGLMNLLQAIGVILGANIGTTVTAQMIAFKIHHYALPILGVGVGLRMFSKSRRWQYYGEIMIGFGMLFYGLTVMKDGLSVLKTQPFFQKAFISFSRNPLLAVMAGALLTMVLQSSSATVGITMTLASSGALTMAGGVGLVLGENIGTTITALLASIGTNVAAKRAARAHMIFNVLGVTYILLLFPLYIRFVDYLTPGNPDMIIQTAQQAAMYGMSIGDKPFIARHLANAHTIFNVVNCLVFLPFMGILAKVSTWMVPSRDEEETEYHLLYLDNRVVDTPSLAISQARKEAIRMAQLARKMFRQTMECFHHYSPELAEKVYRRENVVDMLQKEITDFLVALSPHSLTQEFSREVTSIMYMVNNIERIGDHAENLIKLVERRHDSRVQFSDEAVQEIKDLADKVMEFLDFVCRALSEGGEPQQLMAEAKRYETIINNLEDRYRNGHIKRLNEGCCSVNAGLIFIDMLTNFEKIGDHCYNMAESIAGVK
ncbi:MAG: Na/Pi cotransporter family protein [Deltaproteobacteria bacterium]|jgi:phosphate:Na+ symporter|nr:Na/Pi cotransporter family protein [Deltaproteobacteria bacterium]